MTKRVLIGMALALLNVTVEAKCPPEEWDNLNCNGGKWPPPAWGPCCHKSGSIGSSSWHCNSGVNTLDSCCTRKPGGRLECKTGSEETDKPSPSTEETSSAGADENGFDKNAVCPPPGWDRCAQHSKMWPPPEDGFCCGTSGWLGKSHGHCNNGGINAMDKCCKRGKFGHFKCKLPPGACPKPPKVCTGDAKIDAVLRKSNIGCNIGLTNLNPLYKWTGFCKAVRQFNALPGGRKLFLGDKSAKGCGQGLSNIAALLAQAMWESGGDAPWSACDENNYTRSDTASCTQRADGSLYASLNDQPWACPVDKGMKMTAETFASWTPGPMKCEPGTKTAGCCWWGRGAIQTTGPNNYGNLNSQVFQKIPALKHINLCKNPEAICQNDSTKWLGAIFYWANDVQGFADSRYKKNFFTSLRKFVNGNFKRSASVVNGADFASGTGGVVNNGWWSSTPHKNEKRLNNFDMIMDELKAGGLETCNSGTTDLESGSEISDIEESEEDVKEETEDETEFEPEKPSEKKYKVFFEEKAWSAAEMACKEWGGHLVSIKGRKEQKKVEMIIKARVGSNDKMFWTGLKEHDTEDDWKWSDGTPFDFENWSDENRDCMFLDHSSLMKWHVGPCTKRLNFVCESQQQ